MKKISELSPLILLVIIVGLVLYIFSIDKNQVVTGESLFEKQERCANNRDNAKKQLEESYRLATPYFYDMFYSSKTDTCIYSYGVVLYGVAPKETGVFNIYDYFTNERLYSINYDNSSGDEENYSYNIRPKFNEEIEKYK